MERIIFFLASFTSGRVPLDKSEGTVKDKDILCGAGGGWPTFAPPRNPAASPFALFEG